MKKSQAVEVIDANRRTSVDFVFSEQDASVAQSLGIVIAGSVVDRVSRAISACNLAARLAIESGYLLLSVKDELPHGEFESGVEAMGLQPQRARELMRTAKFITSLPEDRRSEFL